VQSTAFAAPVGQYAQPEKVLYYPNSLRTTDDSEPSARVQLPTGLVETLTSNFCVVFAGNIGSVQAVDTIVEAAAQLQDLTNVRLVLVGSGSRGGWIKQAIGERHLENLLLPGRFPMSCMAELFRLAGCLLVTLKGDEIFSYTVPSKVQAYLAAGKPIIAALNGEGARIVREAGAGLTCAAEDANGLAHCVRTLNAMSAQERQHLGDSGRRYFMQHCEMGRQAKRLVEIIEQRIGAPN
jgi:glycosyltransferase involved in cell wall biosynthesis